MASLPFPSSSEAALLPFVEAARLRTEYRDIARLEADYRRNGLSNAERAI